MKVSQILLCCANRDCYGDRTTGPEGQVQRSRSGKCEGEMPFLGPERAGVPSR